MSWLSAPLPPAPGRTALITAGTALDHGALERWVGRLAQRAAALPPGVVVLTAHPSAATVAGLLALWRAGRCVAMASPQWTAAERARREALLGQACRVSVTGDRLVVDSTAESHTLRNSRCRAGACPPPASTDPADCNGLELESSSWPRGHHPEAALILFTSGSTGEAKAVQLSHAGVAANTAAVVESLGMATAVHQVLFLPLSYSFGLLGQLLPALWAGVPTLLATSLTEGLTALTSGGPVGMVSGVPSHWEGVVRFLSSTGSAPVRAVSHVVSAGAHLPPALRLRLREAFPAATLFNNYGLTECSPRVLCLPSTHPRFFEDVVGLPVPGLEVRAGDDGELLVRGPQVMLGYLGDDAGTADRVRHGWLHSGDQGACGPDGVWSITGRMDELFNVGGERTSPREVERALASVPHVLEAAALAEPDPTWGSRVVAFLVAAVPLSRAEVLATVRETLSDHKAPRELWQVPALPRTANGKLKRSALAATKAGGRRL